MVQMRWPGARLVCCLAQPANVPKPAEVGHVHAPKLKLANVGNANVMNHAHDMRWRTCRRHHPKMTQPAQPRPTQAAKPKPTQPAKLTMLLAWSSSYQLLPLWRQPLLPVYRLVPTNQVALLDFLPWEQLLLMQLMLLQLPVIQLPLLFESPC